MKAVRSRSSRSLAHEAADGRVHKLTTDSLKIKGAHEDTYRLSSNYLIWGRQRKKIGQNRFHDPAPQTRGFLTSNYYEDMVFITRDATGQVVWLESGNSGAGLEHILHGNGTTKGHAGDFKKALGAV